MNLHLTVQGLSTLIEGTFFVWNILDIVETIIVTTQAIPEVPLIIIIPDTQGEENLLLQDAKKDLL
jgi:hypothetical protein